jgi:hypothetical protein
MYTLTRNIKIALVCLLTAICGIADVLAQANPGYLGRTSVVQIDVTGSMGNLIFEGPIMNVNFGASYEFAKSKDFAWNIGYKSINQTMNTFMCRGESFNYNIPDSRFPGSTTSAYLEQGSFNYHVDEFKVASKFFSEVKGAIAPYGRYLGLEFTLDRMSFNNFENITWNLDGSNRLQNDTVSSVAPISIFTLSFISGGRKMLTDQIGLDYNFGMGYTIYQSTPNALLELIDGENSSNNKELVFQTMGMKHFSTSKLFQASVGISYLF